MLNTFVFPGETVHSLNQCLKVVLVFSRRLKKNREIIKHPLTVFCHHISGQLLIAILSPRDSPQGKMGGVNTYLHIHNTMFYTSL